MNRRLVITISLIYICVSRGNLTNDFAARFSATYQLFPPGEKHRLIIACNGGPLKTETALLFAGIPDCIFWPRLNTPGWDIDAYREAAKGMCSKDDMIVCLGESVYFFREGWLKRLVESWKQYGPGMYGLFASHLVRAHLNTTAFACAPSIFGLYPKILKSRKDRYEFEHGESALWRRVWRIGMPAMLVTWDGAWAPGQWRISSNTLWRGDQSGLLAFCNHSDRYFKADDRTKRIWEKNADQAFK